MLLKIALQIARDEYEDRRERQGIEIAQSAGRYRRCRADTATHERIVALRSGGCSIAETACLAGCSVSQVKRGWTMRLKGVAAPAPFDPPGIKTSAGSEDILEAVRELRER